MCSLKRRTCRSQLQQSFAVPIGWTAAPVCTLVPCSLSDAVCQLTPAPTCAPIVHQSAPASMPSRVPMWHSQIFSVGQHLRVPLKAGSRGPHTCPTPAQPDPAPEPASAEISFCADAILSQNCPPFTFTNIEQPQQGIPWLHPTPSPAQPYLLADQHPHSRGRLARRPQMSPTCTAASCSWAGTYRDYCGHPKPYVHTASWASTYSG